MATLSMSMSEWDAKECKRIRELEDLIETLRPQTIPEMRHKSILMQIVVELKNDVEDMRRQWGYEHD